MANPDVERLIAEDAAVGTPFAGVPALLRKSLYTTNPIESMFSMIRDCEMNIKRYRSSKMRQRWLAAVLLHCEQRFNRVKGYESIKAVLAAIDASHEEEILKVA